ncbi:MAG: SCO family protein, partial [Acidimicrobiia bacterium]
VREPRPQVGDVSLPEAGAGPFRFVAEPGHVLLTYFGYTSCPDVCPTTLADLKVVFEDIGAAADRVELAVVTIDPEVDTAELLTAYVRSFVPGAHAIVTTDDAALRAAADDFGADYGAVVNAEGVREVFHTASVYAVDDAGEIRVSWSYGTPADDVVHDLRLLLDR